MYGLCSEQAGLVYSSEPERGAHLISENIFLHPLLPPPGHAHPSSRVFILKQIISHVLSSLNPSLAAHCPSDVVQAHHDLQSLVV